MSFEQVNGAAQKTSTRRYRFEEKLGSLDVLADDQGNAVQRLSFDLWGQRRDASWGVWNTSQIASFNNSETRKGYTGHEMLDAANLIHMGGRMYDPLTGRFLSADILVQAPYLSQSHNRYSYVMNNPMNYVDPTGYAWLDQNWRTVAAIAVNYFLPGSGGLLSSLGANAIWSKVITGMISGGIQSGSLKGALTGGLGAGMFHGIGSHFDKLSTGAGTGALGSGLKAGQFAQKIAAHAAAGGVLSVLNGGKFGHGFASAGVVEALNPAISALTPFSAGQYVASMVVGGTASVIAGGKFANGAVTASFQLAFNHAGEIQKQDKEGKKEISFEERVKGLFSMISKGFPEVTPFLNYSNTSPLGSNNNAEYHDDGIRFSDELKSRSNLSDHELVQTLSHEALHGFVNRSYGGYLVYMFVELGSAHIVPNSSYESHYGVNHAWIEDTGTLMRNHLLYNEVRPQISIKAMVKYRNECGWCGK